MKKYRQFLYVCCFAGIFTLCVVCYLSCYMSVPSQIKIRAGVEETLDFGIPVSGEFRRQREYQEALAVSEQSGSDIPYDAIQMDLNNAVTLKTLNPQTYQLNLKLFGLIPFKEIEVQVIESQKLIPAGIPIGIYVKTKGVLVIGVGDFKGENGATCSPCKYLLQSGDYVMAVNGTPVESKSDFMEIIKQSQGIGTLTYITEDSRFGALGHGINDVDTSSLLTLESGKLYDTDIIAIKKGTNGTPGEMTGLIEYSDKHILGNITANYVAGIYGKCEKSLKERVRGKAVPIGLKQDIELGEAQILCSINGEPAYYSIEIEQLYMDNDNVNRGIVLRITDEYLLKTTGGIIQGMSGAPILQNGKLIGAVTHVLVQDSTKGYGIFIENMLEY